MPLPSLMLSRNDVNPESQYLGIYVLSSLVNGQEQFSKNAAHAVGMEQVDWYRNEREWALDYTIWHGPGEFCVFLRGTENWTQIASYAETLIPRGDDDVGRWALLWATTQINWLCIIMDDMRERFPDVRKVRVYGHSLGGACAYYLTVKLRARGWNVNYECLTYGEPKCLSEGDTFEPQYHCRMVSVLPTVGALTIPFDATRPVIDPVIFLPPIWATGAIVGGVLSKAITWLGKPIIGWLFRKAVAATIVRRLDITPVQQGDAIYQDRLGNQYTLTQSALSEFADNFGAGTIVGLTAVDHLHLVDETYFDAAKNRLQRFENKRLLDLTNPRVLQQRRDNMWNNWIRNQMYDWMSHFPADHWTYIPYGYRFINVQIFVLECIQRASSLDTPNDNTSLLHLLREGIMLNSDTERWVMDEARQQGVRYRNIERMRTEAAQAEAAAQAGAAAPAGISDVGAGPSVGSGGDWGDGTETTGNSPGMSQMQSGPVVDAPVGPSATITVQPESIDNGTVNPNSISYLRPQVIRISPTRYGVFMEGREILAYDNKPAANRAANHAWVMIRQLALLNLSPEDFAKALEGLVQDLESLTVNIPTTA